MDNKSYKNIQKNKTIISDYNTAKIDINNNLNKLKNENEKNEKLCTDIALSRLFLHKRNNYFTEKGFLKQICISPRDIVTNVNESYDYFQKIKKKQRNVSIDQLKNTKMQETLYRFESYKDKCNEISKSLTRNHQRCFIKKNKSKDYFKKTKIKEMGALLSNNTILKNETEIFKNLVRELKFYFSEDYDIISEYFKINSNLIKNEGRQIKFFNIALDLVKQIIQVYEDKKLNNTCDIAIDLYNALFEDFRDHLSLNSLNRANFLYKLWNFKQEEIDKKINKINESLNDAGIKMEGINEKNSRLLEEIKVSNKKYHTIENDKFILKNENDKLKFLIPEKEKRIEDLEHIISDLNEDLQKRINAYSDLLNKYNARFQGQNILHLTSLSNNFDNEESLSKTSSIDNKNDDNINIKMNYELNEDEFNKNFNNNKNNNSNENKNNENENNNNDNKKSNINKKRKLSINLNYRNSMFIEKKDSNRHSVALITNNKENQRRNQILRSVINKQKKKENENKDENIIKERKSIFGMNLKSKIKQTSNYINDLQKFESNPNIFGEELEKPNEIKTKIIENKKNENKEIVELDLYMNKGVEFIEKYKDKEVQTDISGTKNENISNNLLEDLLNGENNEEIKNKISQFFIEYELKTQEILQLREDLEKIQDSNEHIIETYSDIFNSYKDTMKFSKKEIENIINNNNTELNKENETYNILNEINEKINNTLKENQVSDMYDFGDEYANSIRRGSLNMIMMPKEEEILNYNKDNKNNNNNIIIEEKKKKVNKIRRKSNIFDQNKLQQAKNKAFQKRSEVDFNNERFNYESIYHEFLKRKKDIKLSMTLRKVLKNVDYILFDFIEQVYFRKDKLKYSRDERYIDFGEAVYFYFLKNYGVEKLVEKKYIGFLRGLYEYENENGRIKIFLNLLQIKRFDFDEKKKVFFRRKSNDDNSIDFYSNFVTRQIILTIQFLRVNNFIVKVINDQGIPIVYIKYPKLTESLISHISNFHISQQMKDKITNSIELNKKSVEKVMSQVILFDKIIDMLFSICVLYEHNFTSTLKIIFNSFCFDDKLNFFEYLTLNEYLLGHKVSYELLNKLFFVDKENKMDFERFETIIIELDNLDMNKFNEFSNYDINKVKKTLLHLKEIILSKQVTIFDNIINRLKVVKYKQISDFFIDKTSKIKNLIAIMKDEEFEIEHFLSIKLLDKVSLNLYQESKVYEIFGSLEKIHNLISLYNVTDNENYLLSYIRSKNQK